MMTLETTDYSIAATPAARWGAFAPLTRLKSWLAARQERRTHEASYAALLKADDYLLLDIGVTRHDVAQLLADVRNN